MAPASRISAGTSPPRPSSVAWSPEADAAALRSAILAAQDIDLTPVDVPEWGVTVYVKTLSNGQRDRYLKSIRKTVGKGKHEKVEVELEDATTKLLVLVTCDKDGQPVFTDAGDVQALRGKSAKAMQRISDAAAKKNGFDEDAEEEAKNASAGDPTKAGGMQAARDRRRFARRWPTACPF